MYDILKRKSTGLKRELVDFAQQLVRQPSPSLKEREVGRLIHEQMEHLGYDNVIQDDSGNVLGILFSKRPGPTLLLNCHMDTVQPGDLSQWTEDPFSANIKDGKLYGCGASDCKGGLAAQVFSGALLKRSMLPFQGNLIVAATVGQEQGGNVGIQNLMARTLPELELSPTYAILGEPTNLGLYYGHDGWLEMDIHVEGSNAYDVNDAAKTIFEAFDSHSGTHGDQHGPDQWLIKSPLYESGDDCGHATIEMNHRFHHSQEPTTVIELVKHQATLAAQVVGNVAVNVVARQETLQTYTGTRTVVKKITHAWEIDPFCTLMERSRHALEAAGCQTRASKWRLGRAGMATAGGFLTQEYQIPTIGYGPGHEDVIHGPNEFVDIKNITEAVYGTTAIIHSLIGIPVFGWTSDEI